MLDCTKETLNRFIKEVKKDMSEAGIPFNDSVPFELANTKRKIGCCYYVFNQMKRKYCADKITISEIAFLDSEQSLKNVICHELIHSAEDCVGKGHKGKWKEYANTMNYKKPEYNIQRITNIYKNISKDKHFKYKVKCNGCGNEFYNLKKTILIRELENGGCKTRICSKCKCGDFSLTYL